MCDEFFLNPEDIRGVDSSYGAIIDDTPIKLLGQVNHPSFETLRRALHDKGYIHMETGWINGDYALKPFKLNGHLFKAFKQFPCAAGCRNLLKLSKDSITYEGE